MGQCGAAAIHCKGRFIRNQIVGKRGSVVISRDDIDCAVYIVLSAEVMDSQIVGGTRNELVTAVSFGRQKSTLFEVEVVICWMVLAIRQSLVQKSCTPPFAIHNATNQHQGGNDGNVCSNDTNVSFGMLDRD